MPEIKTSFVSKTCLDHEILIWGLNGKWAGTYTDVFYSNWTLRGLFFLTTSHIHQSKHIFIVWFILCLEAFHALTLRWLHWGKLGVHYFAQGHFYMQTRETEDWTTTFLLVNKPLYPLTQSHPLKCPFILDCGVSRSLGSSSVFRGFLSGALNHALPLRLFSV